MDRLHIMTVLGTGSYEPVFYDNKDHGQDIYVQSAIVRKFIEPGQDIDVTVYMTDASKKKHGQALMKALRDEFSDITLHEVLIPFAQDEAEIMQIFETIYEQIEENDEIVFDITHSFRSIPMIIMSVLQYARVLKSCKLRGIYYGAFEAKDDDGVAPIIDLSLFNNIVEWSFAAEQFSLYGNAAPIAKAFPNDHDVVSPMVNLANCIMLNRGSLVGDITLKPRMIVQTSIKKAFDKFEALSLSELDMIGKKPLAELIAYAKRRYAVLSRDKDYEVGMAVVRLCIDFNMISQGYTALNETIITYVCESNGLDCNDKDYRDIVGLVLGAKNQYRPSREKEDDDGTDDGTDDGIDDERKFFFNENTTSKRAYNDASDENKAKIEKVFEVVDKDLVKLWSSITEYRNDINHFGRRTSPLAVDILKSKLEKNYEKAKKIMSYNETKMESGTINGGDVI